MPINRVQFQRGMSMPEFMSCYGSEQQCADALFTARWPGGFRCPRCAHAGCWRVRQDQRTLMQCAACRHQCSLTAGTVMDSTKLALRTWFLAFYLLSQAKTGLSALALSRHLGVTYRTGWLMHHKIMCAMAQADALEPLQGDVQIDDAYLGGECPGQATGRGSPNKVPIVAAVALSEQGQPMRAKLTPIKSFTNEAIRDWARTHLTPGCDVRSDGLSCFAGVIDAGCAHSYIVVGERKPRDLPQFRWVNTVLGNLKTAISGAYKAFKFGKYAHSYLGAFSYRFNHRFDLHGLVLAVCATVAAGRPLHEWQIRGQAELA